MNEIIQKVPQPVVCQDLINFEPQQNNAQQGSMVENVLKPVLRHWVAALSVFIAAVAIGVPAIWYFVVPLYDSTGAIEVAPNQQNILYKDVEAQAVITNYQTYMNTQVDLMASYAVLERAADELKKKNLSIVGPNPFVFLRDALASKQIVITPPENIELIKIVMKSQTPKEAEEVVDAIIQAYMSVEVSQLAKGNDDKLVVLENELHSLTEKLHKQRQVVRQMSEEFGTTALTGRQDMMLQQVTSLQTEITKVQIQKADLETQIQMLEKTSEEIIPLEKVLNMRSEFTKADTLLKNLSDNVAQLEQGLVVASQTMTPENPELQRRKDMLEAMKKRLKERQNEIAKNFDDMLKDENARNRLYRIKEVNAELERKIAEEKSLNSMLAKHNTETIALGRKHLAIKDQQEQAAVTEEMYNTVRQRIQELEMERKRPGQVSIAYNAASLLAKDQRGKFTIGNLFGAAILAMMFAIMLDRMDRRIHNPEAVSRRIGVRLIGTTINSRKLDRAMLNERITDDFQAIRANLGLFNDEKIPHKLVVTSAHAGEGKTTFAINLATSMAKAGTKVLLIDGDMRKPEVGMLLRLNGGSNGVRKVLLGYSSLQDSVRSVPSTSLDVLLGDDNDSCDCFELLTRPLTARAFESICARYENVIIDTPPVLAVPDALLWTKMADAVVLTSFAGQTQEPDMQRAIERLRQIDARVLGVVVNNVPIKSSYNYGYGYGYGNKYSHTKTGNNETQRRSILLSTQEQDKSNIKAS